MHTPGSLCHQHSTERTGVEAASVAMWLLLSFGSSSGGWEEGGDSGSGTGFFGLPLAGDALPRWALVGPCFCVAGGSGDNAQAWAHRCAFLQERVWCSQGRDPYAPEGAPHPKLPTPLDSEHESPNLGFLLGAGNLCVIFRGFFGW